MTNNLNMTAAPLGQGYYGVVTHAHEGWVAKRAKSGQEAKQELREEFLVYGAMHALQGKLIPKMHPASCEGCLILEEVKGRTILEVATSTNTSPYTFGVLLLHACAALSGLHAHGWAHGDAHAGNILVWSQGARLVDLSFAKQDSSKAPPGWFEEHCYADFCRLAESFYGVLSPKKWGVVRAVLGEYL